jgi:hypothetical protein
MGSNPMSSNRRILMFDHEDYVPQSKSKHDEYEIKAKEEDIIEEDEEEIVEETAL